MNPWLRTLYPSHELWLFFEDPTRPLRTIEWWPVQMQYLCARNRWRGSRPLRVCMRCAEKLTKFVHVMNYSQNFHVVFICKQWLYACSISLIVFLLCLAIYRKVKLHMARKRTVHWLTSFNLKNDRWELLFTCHWKCHLSIWKFTCHHDRHNRSSAKAWALRFFDSP